MGESSHSRPRRNADRPTLARVALRTLSLVAPPACVACGRHAGAAEPLCGRCRRGLPWLGGDPVRIDTSLPLWAPVAHEGPARALVAALKFRGAVDLAATMAAQIAASAPPEWLEAAGAAPILVPVPLHPARRRRRGFNQAERIATALGARTGLGVADSLERTGPATRQVGRDSGERRAIRGTVSVRPRGLVPRSALVVDDVATTGATLAACAAALREAGASEVAALAYARTPGR